MTLAPRFMIGIAFIGSLAACSDSKSSSDTSTTTASTEVATTTSDGPDTTVPDTVAPESTLPDTVAPDVVTIDPDGIGEAKLGGSPDLVIPYFTSLFGESTIDTGWTDGGSCDSPTIRIVQWPNLYTMFIEGPSGTPGTESLAFFSYGIVDDVYPSNPLATDRGLVVGDTVDRLLELYPEATAFDGSLGGRFYEFSDGIVGPNGMLINSDPEIVASIEAGDWPCGDVR